MTPPNYAVWIFLFFALAPAPAALAEVVVVAGAGSTLAPLSRDQVADIYMGRNLTATPVDQAEASPVREEFYTKVTGRSAAQVKSHWAKLSFTGRGTPPKEAPGSAEVKRLLGTNPAMVGYLDRASVDASVKVLFSAP